MYTRSCIRELGRNYHQQQHRYYEHEMDDIFDTRTLAECLHRNNHLPFKETLSTELFSMPREAFLALRTWRLSNGREHLNESCPTTQLTIMFEMFKITPQFVRSRISRTTKCPLAALVPHCAKIKKSLTSRGRHQRPNDYGPHEKWCHECVYYSESYPGQPYPLLPQMMKQQEVSWFA